MPVGARRRDRVGAAGQVEVDLARDQRLVHGGDVADQLGALEYPLGGLGEFRDLVVGVRLEGIEAGDARRCQNTFQSSDSRMPYLPAIGGSFHRSQPWSSAVSRLTLSVLTTKE